jgi:RHH-type transcriptional regulator, rel operon repressor / antitoxin RelB
MLAIRLPVEIEKRLDILAKKTGRTKTYYVREAILSHVEEIEQKYLALGRLNRKAKRWTQEELEKGLDLEG